MAITKPTEVSKYLSRMITYVEGDLREFKQLCKNIEDKEKGKELSIMELILDTPTFITSSISDSTQAQGAKNKSVENSTSPSLIKYETYFRLTIPITLTLFSVIDILGFLIGEHKEDYKTKKNFKAFFSKSKITVEADEIEMLNEIFRKGLVHTYFPKLSMGISYHSTNEVYPLFFKTNSIDLILNVNKLENIVIPTLGEIHKQSIQDEIMEDKYEKMINYYQDELGDKIKKMSAKVKLISSTLTTTTTTQG